MIDKDFASSLLATASAPTCSLISTAVEKVALNFGKPDQQWLDRMTLAEAKAYLAEGTHFAKGSMAPKIRAIIGFLEGRRHAIITDPENIGRALRGETGHDIVRDGLSAARRRPASRRPCAGRSPRRSRGPRPPSGRPSYMTRTRSFSARISSRSSLISSTAVPLSAARRRYACTCSTAATSRPRVGDAATSTLGFASNSRAITTFWRLPPER